MDRARETLFAQKRSFYESFHADENTRKEHTRYQRTNRNIKRSKRPANGATTQIESAQDTHAKHRSDTSFSGGPFGEDRFWRVRQATERLSIAVGDDDENDINAHGIERAEIFTSHHPGSRPKYEEVLSRIGTSDLNKQGLNPKSALNGTGENSTLQPRNCAWMMRDAPNMSFESQTSNHRPVARSLQPVSLIEQDQAIRDTSTEQTPRPISYLASQVQRSSIVDSPKPSQEHARMPDSSICVNFDDYLKIQKQKKQKDLIRQAHPNHRIFEGFCFLFIPNNEIARHRSDRIRKCLEYGALWAKKFSSFVTHIIADDEMSFADVAKWLRFEKMPTTLKILKATYIPWCLQWRRAMDPSGTMYELQPPPSPNSEHTKAEHTTPTQSKGSLIQLDSNSNIEESQGGKSSASNMADPATYDAQIARIEQQFHFDNDEDANYREHEVQSESETSASIATKGTGQSSVSVPQWQRSFSCMHGGSKVSHKENPNARTIDILQQMLDYYESTQDHWRIVSYRKAISALKRETVQIKTKHEAEAIAGIGTSIASKIEEIVFTNNLRKLDVTKDDGTGHALSLFLDIYGVGYQQASKWVEKGHRTLEDVVKFESLTENQKVGVEHFRDFQKRIPRAEIEECSGIVTGVLQDIDGRFQTLVAGSYRRGSSDSGDIDLIITRPEKNMHYIRTTVHGRLVPLLYNRGFLKATLADMSNDNGSKWHGACQIPTITAANNENGPSNQNPWRRIDFLLVPPDEVGAAVLYFTGNDIFNRSMRLLARRKGMRLNQHGLFKDAICAGDQTKPSGGVLIESKSEQRIFEILGVPWREPHERIC